MTGKIIRLRAAEHQETQLLLPWYANGRLDAPDQARVEAHLKGCARCRAELEEELRLKSDVADLPLDVEYDRAAMLERLNEPPPRHGGLSTRPGRRVGAAWLGWGVAAGLGVVLALGFHAPRPAPPTVYHALSAPAGSRPGDLVVLFRPDTTESQIRAALRASGARLVDGPTAADAYVLSVPLPERDRALAELRACRGVIDAEPIDQATAP
jgi:anti-sigma factor RsiW